MDPNLITIGLEVVGFALGIVFIFLLISENIWCWFFGILQSILMCILMFSTKLYSEGFLYIFYVGIGIYGWYHWASKSKTPSKEDDVVIAKIKWWQDGLIVIGGIILSFGVFHLIKEMFDDAQRPLADAFTSAFSIIASYMEAQKWLSSWIFWIVINAVTVFLYLDRELKLLALQMVVYFLLSIFGFIQWHKKYKSQLAAAE